ncbi:MAG TPA: thioredoxin fold domain-containing protein [Ramlibacter sp.]|nr:thioredoxin fold domain-containing protein [Ramlibacter sp.]
MKPIQYAALLSAALFLSACGKQTPEPAAPAKAAAEPVSIAAIQSGATGFTVGSPMSVRTVYVFFDPQCPHCAALWNSAKPLKSQAKFVWIPVGIMSKASTTQGATLLAAKDPVALMDEHEASLLAKKGGISAATGVDAQEAQVAKNTALMNRFGFASIPTVVAVHAQTGAVVSNEGSMPTAALANFLGLQVPAGQ